MTDSLIKVIHDSKNDIIGKNEIESLISNVELKNSSKNYDNIKKLKGDFENYVDKIVEKTGENIEFSIYSLQNLPENDSLSYLKESTFEDIQFRNTSTLMMISNLNQIILNLLIFEKIRWCIISNAK